ncbi:ankyrin repeat-containing domain protein [Trichoderma chlorosporum]
MWHRKDLKRRFKNLQEKLGSSQHKDQHDASGPLSVKSGEHQNKTASVTSVQDIGSDSAQTCLDKSSERQKDNAPTRHLPKSSQNLVKQQPDDADIRELWNAAYEKLRMEDSNLIEEYEKNLPVAMVASLDLPLALNASIRERMQAVLEYKMKEVNSNVWKLKFRSSEVEVRDLLKPYLGVVSLANEYITGAVSVNPYASLAWAGVSLLLPLFLNPSAQMASLAKGLEFVSTLIAQSRMREELYIRRYESKAQDNQLFPQSHREYKNGLERLYRKILRFQATSYCYYSKTSASRFSSDMVKWNDWDQLIDEIREEESLFNRLNDTWRDIRYDNECSAAEKRHLEAATLWFTIGENVSSLERTVKDAQEQQSRIELLGWLCNIDHTELYNSARNKHKDGTGEWLIDRSEIFKTWEERVTSKSFLWLHGKAGSGKSILSSSVIKHLQDRYSGNAMTVLAYFYFSFSDIQKQNVDGMLASLIKQISAHRPYIPQSVQRLGHYKHNGGRPDTKTLIEALIDSMEGFSAVYIVIDALDECPMLNDVRKTLLKSLYDMLKKAADSLHILCTSRKEVDIDKATRPLLSEPWGSEIDLSIQHEVLDDDIGRYIDFVLADAEYDTWPEDIKKESKNALMEKADGMFQYVRCQFENLQKLSSVGEIRMALQNLPDGLDSTYERMLQNIDIKFRPQVIASLKWLAFSFWSLEVDQLAEIFVLPPPPDNGFKTMPRLFSSTDVLKYFPGLIITREDADHKMVLVALAHFSIKEYLTSDRILQGRASVFAFTEADAHLHIGRLCLAYVLHISSNYDEDRQDDDYMLVNYASYNWAEHLEMIPSASWPPEVLRDALLSLSIRSQSLLLMVSYHRFAYDFHRRPYCYTSWRGHYQLTEMLISTGGSSNKYLTQVDLDEGLRYAMHSEGHRIAKLFLDKGAQIYHSLEDAAKLGQTAIVRLLIDGADANTLVGKLDSPLRTAVWNGHLETCKLLVDRGADINSPFSKTQGLPKVVALREVLDVEDCLHFLFDNGAGITMDDNSSLTAALYATTYLGLNETSRLLLDRDANVNEVLGHYGCVLQRAMHSPGGPEIDLQFIRELLDHGANPNGQGGAYETALQYACVGMAAVNKEKMIQVMELLIDRGADAACYNRNVPISVIQMLLGKGAEVNAQGGYCDNTLQAACWRGAEEHKTGMEERSLEVVQLLLDSGADVHSQGALQAACAMGDEDVVRLLVGRGVDVNAQGGKYGTPLQAACARGNLEMVNLLLKKGASVNVEAGYHGTALQVACANNHIEVARVLLEHGANIHLQNNGAWHAAVLSRDDDLVRLLLDRGVDVNDPHGPHGSALHSVIQRVDNLSPWIKWYYYYNEELLHDENYDFDWTARIRLLLERGADPNLAVDEYGTVLQTACAVESNLKHINLFAGAVGSKVFLEMCPEININAQGGLFGSALQAAAYSGQTPTINLLLNRGAHVNARGGKYGSALNAAVIAGNWDIVRILLDAGAIPDCHILSEPDEEWLQRVLEDDGQGGIERYRKFWEVEKANDAEKQISAD